MPTNRRQFLRATLGTGSALALGAGAYQYTRRSTAELQAVTRTGWALGANVSMTALARDRATADAALEAAFAEIEQVEEVMSLYRPHSQLCRLNRDGVLDAPHPMLIEVLEAALALSARTEGAFDVTVQPLWTVYSEAKKAGRLPEDEAIATARTLVDWRRVELSADRIRLHKGGAITLNGIAQGYAADRAMAALRRHGIDHALVDTGEIGALGFSPRRGPWRVGIQHPREDDAYLSLANLDGRALATSGDYETSFTPDRTRHHIFDPRTGVSPTELASVSIAAPTTMQADALSTAVFVLGPERGLDLVRATPGVDALMVLKDGTTTATDRFPWES